MSHIHICHNPNCTARFSKTNMSASRRVPELVNTAALDAYYVANPEKAVNRSQDRVYIRCSHQNNCRPPTCFFQLKLVFRWLMLLNSARPVLL